MNAERTDEQEKPIWVVSYKSPRARVWRPYVAFHSERKAKLFVKDLRYAWAGGNVEIRIALYGRVYRRQP